MVSSSENGRNIGCYPANPDFALSNVESQKLTGKVRDDEVGLDWGITHEICRLKSKLEDRYTQRNHKWSVSQDVRIWYSPLLRRRNQ